MKNDLEIVYSKKYLDKVKKRIPDSDFIDAKYDMKSDANLKGIFVLFSTPRSGSTMLCDILYKNGFCLAHEYFQPYEYLPILAERWNCLSGSKVNKKEYFTSLAKYRVMPSGWLGINLHGHHIQTYLKFLNHFSDVEFIFMRIQRRDKLSQAISYEIASQTKKWSSNFKATEEPKFSYKSIVNRINQLNAQDFMIDTFIQSRGISVRTVYYEDLLVNKGSVLSDLLPIDQSVLDDSEPSVKRQSNELNEKWKEMFLNQFDSNLLKPVKIDSLYSRFKKLYF